MWRTAFFHHAPNPLKIWWVAPIYETGVKPRRCTSAQIFTFFNPQGISDWWRIFDHKLCCGELAETSLKWDFTTIVKIRQRCPIINSSSLFGKAAPEHSFWNAPFLVEPKGQHKVYYMGCFSRPASSTLHLQIQNGYLFYRYKVNFKSNVIFLIFYVGSKNGVN